MRRKLTYQEMICRAFGLLFVVIGILNIILIHPVPGIIYLAIAFFFFPRSNHILKNNFGFSIPFPILLIMGIVLLWGTMAVGDLMEWFEARML